MQKFQVKIKLNFFFYNALMTFNEKYMQNIEDRFKMF